MASVPSIPLIAQSYIKYDRLVELTNYAFTGSNATMCDVYIDLYSILSPLYGVYDPSMDSSYNDIASAILNMVAHYRRFFWSKYRVETRIIFIYSDNVGSYNKTYFPEYNSKHANRMLSKKYIHDSIKRNLNLVSMITPYLNNVSYFSSSFDSATMIYHVANTIEKQGEVPNIIISKDTSIYQLIGAIDNSPTVVFRPKKQQGQDMSYPVNIKNIYSVFALNCDVNIKEDKTCLIHPSLFSTVLAFSKIPDRNFKSVLNVSTVLNKFAIFSERKWITSYTHDINSIIELFDEKQKMSLYKNNVLNRFKAIDCIYQAGIMINNPERLNYKGFMNLYDPNGLHEITSMYFKSNPLNLESM